MKVLKFDQLEPGNWYIPVFERLEPLNGEFGNVIDTHRTDSRYYKYLGGVEFETDDGDLVDSFFNPELQLQVAPNAPDGFLP